MNIQLTTAQRLQQELINGFITDLEKQIQQGATGAAVNADLGNTLNTLFATFDRNKDAKFNASELTGLTGHLRQMNNDQNIAQLFTTDGQINFATTNKADITGDGKFNGQEDLVALQQIIGSRTSLAQTVPQASILTNNGQVKSGNGNVPGGLNHFNGSGAYFVTTDGSTILTDVNVGGHTTMIYNSAGKMISRIWGDPHVEDDSGVGGDDWHFGNDSTFILADGTEIMFNTEGNFNNNVFITTGLYIKSGNDVYQTGQSFGTSTTGVAANGARNSSISKLGISATEFDAQYADAADDKNGAGVFAYSAQANSGRGGWAIMTEGGNFRDVKYEGWGDYLQAGRASFKGQYDGQVSINKAQMIAALDGDAVRSFKSLSNSPASSQTVAGSNPPIKADDLFLNYYFKAGANTKELKAFSNMISNGSSAEKLSVLDNYIRNGAEIPLTDDQESKFLSYLITPATSGIAKTYLALIKNNASPEKFELLDKLAKGEYSLNEAQENKFLDYLSNETNTDITKTYLSLVTGNDANKAGKLAALEALAANNATDKLDDTQEDVFLNYLTTEGNVNIAQTYASILNGNETDTVKTAKIASLGAFALANDNGAISSDQENKFLDYLKSSNIRVANTYLTFIKDNASPEKFEILDKLAKGEYSLNEAQENTFFDYLNNETNTDIAKTYLSLVTGNDANKAGKLAALEALATNNATDKLDDTQEDVFLNYLTSEGNINIAQTYAGIINGNETDTVKTAKLASLAAFTLANDNGAISSAQENKFLDYLKSSSAGVSKTYLALIKNNASPERFVLLDKLANGEYSLNETQENTFFDFLTKFQNTKLAETYAGIIKQGGNQSSVTYLEDYAKGNLDIALTINQENQMLDYLGGSGNSNIARSYVNFIQASATEKDLKTLNDIYQKSNNIKQPIKPEDLAFFRTLENLTDKYRLQISPQQFLGGLDHTSFTDINQLVAKIATHVETNNDSTKTQNGTNLSKDLLRVMIDPVKYDLSTNYKGEAVPIFKDILGLQLKALGELDQNDPKVIQSIKYANDRLTFINSNLNPITGSLNSTQKTLYNIFTNAFPAGQTPTEAQSLAAAELITTGGNFGSNVAFLTNYAKFVSSGDTTSANNLVEIANYFGSKTEYATSIRGFIDKDLDAKTISTAKEVLNLTKMLDTQNSPDLTGVILTANRTFLIDTMLNKEDTVFNPATESDLTKSFFQSLKESFSGKPDSLDNKTYSDFARNAISKFSNDLKSNGVVNRNSFTTVLVNDIGRGSLGIYANDGVAKMQIDVFEGMLSFYQSQIQQENAKPEPNTSKISQWQSQINANQSAINALRSTLS